MAEPDSDRFLLDLEAKPASLSVLAGEIDDLWPADLDRSAARVTIGMGSSRFAASSWCTRWQGRGIAAWSGYASADAGPLLPAGALVIGISASGATPETVEALARHRGSHTTVAITNRPRIPLADAADLTVPLLAGDEVGGVACRTFQHTLAVLSALDGTGVAATIRRVADATDDLLERRDDWLPAVASVLADGAATFMIAPAERLSSAEQGALMLREGPRRTAAACEAGDWLHVDVYLSKPLDYRALIFAGSRSEPEIMGWIRERGGKVVAVGGEIEGATATVRYRHDDDPSVALLTEVLVAELVAWSWWSEGRAW